ncbi:MAG: CDP-alcohol phosphatidyltransferase family protein, partial [Clostridia bacterium]|nr:CDP-alcohol phosphatidyltransferase family protein [Clostridia bacterium]
MSETEKKHGIITIPNLLSLFRVCLIPVMVYLYLTGKSNYAVGGVLLLSGITDILDGFIARRFNLETNLGRILDPVADKMTHIIICAVLMRVFPLLTWMLVIFCVKEACLSILGWRYMRMTGIVNSARWYGKVGSIVQYAVMLSLIVLPHLSETTITLLIAICMGTHIVALFLYARFYLYSESPKHQNMQPADWQSFVMALLFVGSIFV